MNFNEQLKRGVTVFLTICTCFCNVVEAKPVELGIDRIFSPEYIGLIKEKRVGLVSHHCAINRDRKSSLMLFFENENICKLTTLFTLEHGFYGSVFAEVEKNESDLFPKLHVYSLQNAESGLTEESLRDVDVIVYDVQDIGVRSYTFMHALFKILCGAAKQGIPVIVLDRPNPMGGKIIDGPLQKFVAAEGTATFGLPYCHGMTIAELAGFFKSYHKLQVSLNVVPMKGWNRSMSFNDTELPWIPTSPQIPEAETAFFYATTGLIGYLSLTSIGVGYTLPFKILGAPWIDSSQLVKSLNQQNLPGVVFLPFQYEPFFGKYKMQECSGVLLSITDKRIFKPVETQFVILGVLKTLYPQRFSLALQSLKKVPGRFEEFTELVGSQEVLKIMMHKKYIAWPLKEICRQSRRDFESERIQYLIKEYADSEVSN